MTTKEEIRDWLRKGKEQGATHTIIACDTFDYLDYPVHIMPGEDVREKEEELDKVMEVYSHAIDHEGQLNERRSWHYETADEVDTKPTEVDFTRWRTLLAEARDMLDRHDYPEAAMHAIEQEIKPHASWVSAHAHDVFDACYVVASQARRFFTTAKGKRVDGKHLLALNARQSDTISRLASENQALRQGVVCYVVGRLNASSLGLWHVQASRDEASKVPWLGNADVHVNIFQTKPMETYTLALQEAARIYERDFPRIAERLPLHHKGKPYGAGETDE